MISISFLFEALADEKVSKVEVSKNYIIQDLKDRPPEEDIETYRRKITYDKDGNKHIINLAILKGGGTKATSIWHTKKEGSARAMLNRTKKNEPDKVHIKNDPEEDHNYLITVDVARGVGSDYSAFIVFDITNFPYRTVAKYKNNEIKPMMFPAIIHELAKAYNDAWLLIEVNDIGDQVANILHYDLEYDNVMMCAMRGRAGQVVGSGFSGKKSQLGVRMTSSVKKLGCSNLRTLVEDDKLLINDYDIISELTTFIQKGRSFEAEEGCNDDLAMCLVIFSWLVAQDYFKEMTNNDVRKRIYEEHKNQIEQDMAPFGFILDGLDEDVYIEQETGDRWVFATAQNENESLEVWNVDEYGDRSHMWDYR